MTAEFNELLPLQIRDNAQIWIINSCNQAVHLMNEFYVRRIARDRLKFIPIIPAPFATGKSTTVLVR
ncbi:MAG TPA: hypothetical protein V6D10_25030 [Trichocoleus sp.]|jgi:hypothetical protein